MEKFTKGAWFYESATGEIYSDNYAEIICDMLPTGCDEFDANAALIAAAPEMYEMLKGVKLGFEILIESSLVNALCLPGIHQQIELINDLLSKARGEK